MDNSYILGVDGGGTRTTAIVTGLDGIPVCCMTGQSTNYNSVGMATARKILSRITKAINDDYGIDSFSAVCIGSSALFSEAEAEDQRTLTETLFRTKHIVLLSDICIALESMLEDGPCALAISGTGSMCAIRDEAGKLRHTGGWGYILGDEGSAYHIAICGIKAAIAAYDGVGPETILQKAVAKHFDVNDMRELIDRVYNPAIAREQVSLFAKDVATCAEAGDSVAKGVLFDSALLLANSMLVLLRPFYGQEVPLGISGGVFENNTLFRKAFEKEVKKQFHTARITRLTYPPHVGALFYCRKTLGLPKDESFLKNIGNAHLTERIVKE